MRRIADLATPQLGGADYPNGGIKNQTDTEEGTAVVNEVYNDPLVNIWKIIQDAGITINGNPDNETNGYQLLQALKRFVNELNDIQQIVSLSGTNWGVNFDIDPLSDKYVFIGQVTENYNSAVSYTFSGTGSNSYSFTSPSGFNANDIVIVVINQSGVKCYSLTSSGTEITGTKINVLGVPLAFNNTDNVLYLSEGKIYTDTPTITVYNVQNTIRVLASNIDLTVIDAVVHKGYLLCLVYDDVVTGYKIYAFNVTDLSIAYSVTVSGSITPTDGTDYGVYMYAAEDYIYISNKFNSSANDYGFEQYLFDIGDMELTHVSSILLDSTFVNTTNYVIKSSKLYTFIGTSIDAYDLGTGIKTNYLNSWGLDLLNMVSIAGTIYLVNDTIAKQFNLP